MVLESELEKWFGFTSFREGQKETISSVLEGNDTLAMLATGTGKSLCYQLPVYMLNKPAIIISPLLSLMQDQVEQLKMSGEKRVVAINSFLSFEEKEAALNRIDDYLFIFLSPEMLSSKRIIRLIRNLDIGLFVVDEAHCISQWGYDFRPSYLQIGEARKELGFPLTLALTATAPREVREDIKRYLQLSDCKEIVTTVNRSNIGLFVEKCQTYIEKEERLLELADKLQKPGIIYFSSKKAAKEIFEKLTARGMKDAGLYHGDLQQEDRVLIQQQFLNGQISVVCATSAFGMGINKGNVRFVIHFHMPQNMESYLQEIGRAGRDGKESVAVLLYSPGDQEIPLYLMQQEQPDESRLQALIDYWKGTYGDHIPRETDIAGDLALFGFTDTQQRLILHFLHNGTGTLNGRMEMFFSQMKEGTEKKLSKWERFYDWFTINGCYRRGILDYFGETASPDAPVCCSNCGGGIDRYYSGRKDRNSDSEQDNKFDWREELSAFLTRENGRDG